MGITELAADFEHYLNKKNEHFPNKHLLNLKKQVSDFEQAMGFACQTLKNNPYCQPTDLYEILKNCALICMPGRFLHNNPIGSGGALSIKASPIVNGKTAWDHMHDFETTANYIQTNIGSDMAYHYLRAFYKVVASKNEVLYHCKNPVLNEISKYEGYPPFETTAPLTPEEIIAIQLAYYSHPSGEKFKKELNDFFILVARMVNEFDFSNESLAASFCYKTFTTGILLHPFIDGNYRSLSILINALLDKVGYEFINFYDDNVRRALALPFGAEKHDRLNSIPVLTSRLIKKSHQSPLTITDNKGQQSNTMLSNHSVLFQKLKTNDPGQAIRRAAANNYFRELVELIIAFPDAINEGREKTALDWAIEKNHRECEKLLRKHGGQEAKSYLPSTTTSAFSSNLNR